MVSVTFDDLILAFDFVSSGGPMEHQAFVSLDTGAIYWRSGLDFLDEEVPPDFEESDRYLEVPHKNDLDLGRELFFEFAGQRLPHRYEDVQRIFGQRGAYRRVKDLFTAQGCLEEWFAFETAATGRALREWCTAHDIQLVGDSGG